MAYKHTEFPDSALTRSEVLARVIPLHPEPSRPGPEVEVEEVDTWWDRAACRGMDAGLFFPAESWQFEDCRQVCFECPVVDECDAAAPSHLYDDDAGMWGGRTPKERRKKVPREVAWAKARVTLANRCGACGRAGKHGVGCRACKECGDRFIRSRKDQIYCGALCRQRKSSRDWYRKRSVDPAFLAKERAKRRARAASVT